MVTEISVPGEAAKCFYAIFHVQYYSNADRKMQVNLNTPSLIFLKRHFAAAEKQGRFSIAPKRPRRRFCLFYVFDRLFGKGGIDQLVVRNRLFQLAGLGHNLLQKGELFLL